MKPTVQDDTTGTRKPTILVVEDNEDIRGLLREILALSGYSVRVVPDGVAALEELQVEVPDVVLSDLYMPRMSGFELLPLVRQGFPLVRVVAMSSAYSGYDVPTGVAADAFYPKASELDGLLEIIETIADPDAAQLRAPTEDHAVQI